MDRRFEDPYGNTGRAPKLPAISDVRVQCHREETGLWRVTITGQARGNYRREDYREIEFLRIAVGQLLAGFGARHGGEPL